MRQFVVIGIGQFGFSVANTLSENKCQVLAIDMDEVQVESVSNMVTHAVQADATDEKTLRALEVEQMDVGIVCLGSVEASVLVSLLLKEMGVKTVVTKALTPLHAKVLRKVGVDRIIFPERDMGLRVAESLISPNILEHVELSANHSVVEIVAPPEFAGKTLKQINVRAKYGVNVIAIKRKLPSLSESGDTEIKEEINISPEADDEVNEGDGLLIVGLAKDIEKIRAL
ncbi:MAG: TrkA family potassium uptake protein [bacterium]